jgi:hypothetical protein
MAHDAHERRRQHIKRVLRELQAPAAPPTCALPPCPPGHLCEVCLDAPAIALQPAPGGGEMGVCVACAAAGRVV